MINVFHIVSNKHWTGAEQYTYDLVDRLRNDPDFYAEVVCRKHPNVLKQYRRLEIPISILPLKGVTDIDSPVRFARLLRKGHNIIHVHSFRDAFMAVMARRISENPNTRVVMTVHGITKPKANYLYRKLYRSVDKFIFVSQMAYDHWMSAARNFNPDAACVIRDSVMENPLAQPAPQLREMLDLQPNQRLIMYHGRLAPEKGIDIALQAVAQLDRDKYHFAIICDGNPKYVAQLKGFIVANKLVRNVTLLGFRENMSDLIAQCDFGVLPSVEPEAMGLANLEYMMQGKAHISTNNGAQQEYVKNGHNALLVEPGNAFSLAAAIKSLIDDREACQRLGQQALDDFNRELNYDIFYNRITQLYRDVLGFKQPQE